MSSSAEPYHVVYSEKARDELRTLVTRARNSDRAAVSRPGPGSHSQQVLGAATEINRRLEIYPQFGEPLSNLQIESGQI